MKLIRFLIKVIQIIIIKPLKFLLSVVRMVTGKLLYPVVWSGRRIKGRYIKACNGLHIKRSGKKI